jgi:exopolyphosphatase/guanosine-5'-triphosphate,3'-diphosphate pyrophosphatase
VGKQGKDATLTFVKDTARNYDPDPAHNEQVTGLALALFDGLRGLHGYGPAERRLLEIAARLHDIGWARVVEGKHNKVSRDMILELEIPGLDPQDRSTCALIARYHTKAPPDASRHRRFASLDPERRHRVEWLAGMLRVADGLDCTHNRGVSRLACGVGRRTVTIRLQTTGDCRAEVEGARQKHELLETKAGRRIEYRC